MSKAHKEGYEIHTLSWGGIEIEARYKPEEFAGFALLEIETLNPIREKLPVTETGYRSHFHRAGWVENEFSGDVRACVISWHDKAAQSKDWKRHIEDSRQLKLF